MYVTDNLLTKPPEMLDLLERVACKAKDKWKLVGFALNIKRHQLNTISQNQNSIQCYSEVFTAWEETVDPKYFTWATIVEALQSPIVEENKLARDIVKWLTR